MLSCKVAFVAKSWLKGDSFSCTVVSSNQGKELEKQKLHINLLHINYRGHIQNTFSPFHFVFIKILNMETGGFLFLSVGQTIH